MPAAISTTMIAATTQSTIMQNGGHQRVLATKWRAVLPEVLESVAGEAGHQQPRRSGHRGRGHDDEGDGHAAFDGDDLRSSVGDGEPDVDGGDHGQSRGVDGRAVQPPEQQRCGGLGEADRDPHSMAARQVPVVGIGAGWRSSVQPSLPGNAGQEPVL